MVIEVRSRAYHMERAGSAPIFDRMQKMLRFLWDEGPHTSVQLTMHFHLSTQRISEILSLLKSEGQVETFKRSGETYWKICDHVEMDS